MSLRDDYIDLLRRYGLDQVGTSGAASEQLENLRLCVNSDGDTAERMRALEVLGMIDALDKRFDGAVSSALEQMTSRDSEGPLADHIKALKAILPPGSSAALDRIYFNEFPTHEFTASARLTPNGYLCLLNTGLIRLLHHFAMRGAKKPVTD
ncbi:MAG: hypothetical protein JRG94_15465 [Deltaproteobacteria bacterium]|nr:hypothetical protein [Deltaproteobacteria bacterium]